MREKGQQEALMNTKSIMILCKVVDNYGDIGVAYRLAKALSDINPSLDIALVCSNLKSFALMADGIDPGKKTQNFLYKNTKWTIIDWDEPEDFTYNASPFPVILECFQCGRPEWLEKILFAKDSKQVFHVLNIEYLTAEQYADDFHLLKSYTRSANVKKIFFMPGFTAKTGGLILTGKEQSLNSSGLLAKLLYEKAGFNILFFAYKRECSSIVKAIAQFQEEKRRVDKSFEVCVFIAAGQSAGPFIEAWEKQKKPFKAVRLPFLRQEEWDMLLTHMDLNFVRGEDSLSRAALAGLPYVWNAYIQDEDYQLVKVDALLERMRPFFAEYDFTLLKEYWNLYNKNRGGNGQTGASNPSGEEDRQEALLKEILFRASRRPGGMNESFKKYAHMLEQNGDLAAHIMEWIDHNAGL